MGFIRKKRLPKGAVLYEVTLTNTISEWVVDDALPKAGHHARYRLIKAEDRTTFCVIDEYSLGKNVFVNYADAVKERTRRTL